MPWLIAALQIAEPTKPLPPSTNIYNQLPKKDVLFKNTVSHKEVDLINWMLHHSIKCFLLFPNLDILNFFDDPSRLNHHGYFMYVYSLYLSHPLKFPRIGLLLTLITLKTSGSNVTNVFATHCDPIGFHYCEMQI